MPYLYKDCANRPQAYTLKSYLFYNAASLKRWIFLCATFIAGLVAAATLLHRGLQTVGNFTNTSLISLWRLGFGQIDPLSLIESYDSSYPIGTNLIEPAKRPLSDPNVISLLANLPQLLVSLLHLNYNSIFTCMVMEKEWHNFAHGRKALRVSSPAEGQRSTYFLSLPYRYATPLIVLSGTMHWLVSQSIFPAQINPNGEPYEPYPDTAFVRSWGYSCIALVFILALGCSMLLAVLLVGAKRLRPGIPFAGHCSAVLSAACQKLPADDEITALPVQWGVVQGDESRAVQHCTFSSFEVQRPVEGRLYR